MVALIRICKFPFVTTKTADYKQKIAWEEHYTVALKDGKHKFKVTLLSSTVDHVEEEVLFLLSRLSGP